MIRSQVGSCFIDVAQGGTSTVLHQLMFPRSQHISTSVTSGSPKIHISRILNGSIVTYTSCPAVVRLGMLMLALLKVVYNRLFIPIFAMIATMSAFHPPAKASGLSARQDKLNRTL